MATEPGSKAAGREGAAPRQALGEPALSEEEEEMHAGWERGRAAQREIFESRREVMLAAHPGKHVAVCNGEVLVADTSRGVDEMVMRRVRGRESIVVEYAMTLLLERPELFLRARGGKVGHVVLDNMRAGDRLEVERAFGVPAGGHGALSRAKIEHMSGIGFVDSL